MAAGKWHFWIDRGGTLTGVPRTPDGRIVAHKLEAGEAIMIKTPSGGG